MSATRTACKRTSLVRAVASAFLWVALAGATTACANDEVGKKKADEACAACHGPAGSKPITPETPLLAGQQYDYLVQSLIAYRKGTRDNAVMSAMAKPLTEKEIRDLAWYFSRQQGLTTKR